VVEKGSLRVHEQTPPGDAIPGLEFMISAIPAKAFVDVTTGSSTAAKSATLYVDPTYFKYDRWHEHYLRYLVTPCPSDTFYRTGSESDTLVNDFLQPAANSLFMEHFNASVQASKGGAAASKEACSGIAISSANA
jgi:hypothetical protein